MFIGLLHDAWGMLVHSKRRFIAAKWAKTGEALEAPLRDHRLASAWRLGKDGRSQSASLAKRLREYVPATVWPAKDLKATETAAIVARGLDVSALTVNERVDFHRDGVKYFPTQIDVEMVFDFRIPSISRCRLR